MEVKNKKINMMIKFFVESCPEIMACSEDLRNMYNTLDSMTIELHTEAFYWLKMNKYWPLVSIRSRRVIHEREKFNAKFGSLLNSDVVSSYKLNNLSFIQLKGWISKLFLDKSKLLSGHMKPPMDAMDFDSYYLMGRFDEVSKSMYVPEHWMIGTTVIPMNSVAATLFCADCIIRATDVDGNVNHMKALYNMFVKHKRLDDSVYTTCINFIGRSNKIAKLGFEKGHLEFIREFALSVNKHREDLISSTKTATI